MGNVFFDTVLLCGDRRIAPSACVCVCARVGSIGSMKFNGVCEVLILVDTAVPQCYR